MTFSTRTALPVSACLALLAFACTNDPAQTPAGLTPSASGTGAAGNSSAVIAGSPSVVGSVPAAAGSPAVVGTSETGAAGAQGAAGKAGSAAAGSGGAGAAGSSAAGTSAAAGSGGAPAAGSGGEVADGGAAGEDDPSAGDPFGGGTSDPTSSSQLSCKDLVCFDVFDCVLWHPEESTQCNFVDCVDFVCTQ
jgi:hypothetical protein